MRAFGSARVGDLAIGTLAEYSWFRKKSRSCSTPLLQRRASPVVSRSTNREYWHLFSRSGKCWRIYRTRYINELIILHYYAVMSGKQVFSEYWSFNFTNIIVVLFVFSEYWSFTFTNIIVVLFDISPSRRSIFHYVVGSRQFVRQSEHFADVVASLLPTAFRQTVAHLIQRVDLLLRILLQHFSIVNRRGAVFAIT